MKRKILSMILGTAIAASLLTGCGGSQQAAATTAAGDTTAAAADSTAAADAAAEAAKAATGEGKKGRRGHAYTVIRALD